MRFSFLLISILLFQITFSQNLIENGNFETNNYCPKSDFVYNEIKKFTGNWTSPNKASPDYYNKCGSFGAGIPNNSLGKQQANSGAGYIGLILIEPMFMYREYVMTRLKEPLEKDKTYCFKMYVSLAEYSRYATNDFGIYLSNEEVFQRNEEYINVVPQIRFKTPMLDNDKIWVELSKQYKAKGDENYLCIGCFSDPFNVQVEKRKLKNPYLAAIKEWSYYYIDDVSLTPISDSSQCKCATDTLVREYTLPQ